MKCALVASTVSLAGCLSFHTGVMRGEPEAARYTNVDGVRVRYTDTGESEVTASGAPDATAQPRPTVVLVHGFASALDVWDTVAPTLARTHRVIALDLKGFGWSDRPAGDYSPDAQAKLVLHLLDQRGVSRTAVVGHSWGSAVALAASMAAPERITKIALYDAWVYEDQLPTFFHWARADYVGEALFGLYYKQRADERIALAFFDKKYVTETLVERTEQALDRPGTVAAALAAVRGQLYSESEQRHRSIDKPTLVMWGREDLVTPLKYGERLARELPRAKLVTYPRCGHFPMIEAGSTSNRDLVEFLASRDEP